MPMKDTYGNGGEELVIPVTAISGTTPIVSRPIDCRDKDAVALQLVVAGGTSPNGAWLVEAALDFVPAVTSGGVGGASSGSYGAPANPGTWSDITALFSRPTTIAAVTNNITSYHQADPHLDARHIRITFTPASGSGNVSAQIYMKNWSR